MVLFCANVTAIVCIVWKNDHLWVIILHNHEKTTDND